MKYLVTDTSGDLIVILFDGEKYYTRYLKGCNTKHSLTLMPYIEECLIESGLELEDLDFYGVVTGPGSFTGIRIGISAIKALAFATHKKVLALTSFQVLAYTDNAPDKVCLLIDANHDNYYASVFENKKCVIDPCFLHIDEIEKVSDNCCIISENKSDELKNLALKRDFLAGDRVSGIINAINDNFNNLTDSEEVVPLYVKKSQAEEELCI